MSRGLGLWASLALVLSVVVTASVVKVFPESDPPVQPASIPVTVPVPSKTAVSLPAAVVGKTTHAALSRGGQAAPPTSGEGGQVSVRVARAGSPTRP